MSNGTKRKAFEQARANLAGRLRDLWIHSGLQCDTIDSSSRFCDSLGLGAVPGFRGSTVEVWGREDVRIIDPNGVEVWGCLFVVATDAGGQRIMFEPTHIDSGFGLEDIETAVATARDLVERLTAPDANGRHFRGKERPTLVARAVEALRLYCEACEA